MILCNPIRKLYPGSILRPKFQATLFLDANSGNLISNTQRLLSTFECPECLLHSQVSSELRTCF